MWKFFLMTLLLSSNAWSSLDFYPYITIEKLSFKERFGTFKAKRKPKEVCYPYQIIQEQENLYRATFPTCQSEILFEKKEEGWSISSSKSPELKKQVHFLNLLFRHHTDESFYGLGTQFTHFRLNGYHFPIVAQEQGNGRGSQPLTRWQRLLTPGIEGTSVSTSHAQAFFISSQSRAFFVPSHEYMELDFTNSGSFLLSHLGLDFDLKMAQASSLIELLPQTRQWLGEQERLPDWVHQGAILGLMQGELDVQKRLERALEFDSVISGLWLQDWVGQRQTPLGPRLRWSWGLDRETYPAWSELRQLTRERDIKLLGYFNPYLSPLPDGAPQLDWAMQKGYLVWNLDDPSFHEIEMGGFKAFLVDLLNPNAYSWLKQLMKRTAQEAQLDGWMADFGEAYPMKKNQTRNHSLYISKWQQLNQEVRRELHQERGGDPLVSFHRAGTLNSARNTGLFWLGDQTTTYDQFDGLQTTITGLLSSGLNQIAYNHSDIGGYFGIRVPLAINVTRSRELLSRWMEVNAFTMVFRSHLGLNPKILHQIDQDENTLKEFSFWSHVFAELFEVRKSLIEEYHEASLPPLRPLFLHHQNESETYFIQKQFLLGENILVSPLFQDHATTHRFYLPEGLWVHLWDNREVESSGEWLQFQVTDNRSPIFFKYGHHQGLKNRILDRYKKAQDDALFPALSHSK
jgi:sulfoquinovosidase